jgi:pectin methylesterase-like acyl-CoA thioesterase
MRCHIGAVCAVLLATGTTAVTGSRALAADTLCVGDGSGCYSTLQAAVDAAHNGDTIRIDRGTFKGGVTVDVSVRIVGDGSDRTILKGGDSVLTIGRYNAVYTTLPVTRTDSRIDDNVPDQCYGC